MRRDIGVLMPLQGGLKKDKKINQKKKKKSWGEKTKLILYIAYSKQILAESFDSF